ncbi:MAG: hypothetical protein JKY11_03910 [Alphaproteobacteria bacterium]|nr:hypothetical protein [Alphaproteobacteria bacterium]
MAKLDGLIRIQKHRVDEKQKILARLYREQEEYERQKQDKTDQIAREKRVAESMANDVLIQLSFSKFRAAANDAIEKFNDKIEKVKTRITLAQDDIRVAFEDLKKTEIVDRTRKAKERKEREKKRNG